MLTYEKPTYKKLFGDFKYGDHMLILGRTGSGKTNFFCWFFAVSPLRQVFFNPVRHIVPINLADKNISEEIVFSEKFEDILNDLDINKICITPTERIHGRKKMTMIWDKVCGWIYKHEDKLHTEMESRKGRILGKYFTRKSRIVLICDELMSVVHFENMTDNHYEIVHSGRNYDISHIGSSQRNQLISKLLTTQSRQKIIFKLDTYDANKLKDSISGIQDSDYLEPYHFLLDDGDTVRNFSPVPLMKVRVD